MGKNSTLRYVWDNAKNTANQAKHGITFEDAIKIFDGPILERQDNREDYGEIRMYAIGLAGDINLTVIYTDRAYDQRRIISAWKSERAERRAWHEKYGGDWTLS